MAKIAKGMRTTIKEAKFLKGLLTTGSAKEAAKAAYNCTSDRRARQMGYEVLAKPRIKAMLQEMIEAEGMDARSLAKIFKRWIECDDGHVAHKWTMSLIDTVDPNAEPAEAPKELHAHQHLHFENMNETQRKFILTHGRYPTAHEVAEIEGEVVEEQE